MLMQAITMGMMSSRWALSLSFFPRKSCTMKFTPGREPMVEKKWRISSWKRIIRASEPTFTSLSRMPPSSRISKICDTNIHTTMKMMMPPNMLAELLSFISR